LSFAQPFSEARGILNAIQREKTDGRDGEASSPIKEGSTEPGTSMSHPVGEMVPRRTKVYTRTDSLQRKYGSTGSNGGKEAHAETASYGAQSGRTRKARTKQ